MSRTHHHHANTEYCVFTTMRQLLRLCFIVSTMLCVFMCDLAFGQNDTTDARMCDGPNSFIYCRGPLLEMVSNFEHHFANSTEYDEFTNFVRRPLKGNPDAVFSDFNATFTVGMRTSYTKPTADRLKNFLKENFLHSNEGLEQTCELRDWTKEPPKIKSIENEQCRTFALDIHSIWKKLCKKVKSDVHENPEQYSALYVPHEYIAPGDAFSEFYYWDTFWIIKGLIVSNMLDTARKQITNLAHMVHTLGHVPNGGRVYYKGRTQPPFLALMVDAYYNATQNMTFLKEMLRVLDKEFQFWDQQRQMHVTIPDKTGNFTVYQYRANTNNPRPEQYVHDMQLAQNASTQEAKRHLWHNLASVAESGIDFSSRWTHQHSHRVSDTEIINIAPVDLNSVLCYNMKLLAGWFAKIGDGSKASEYEQKHEAFSKTFESVFYNAKSKIWHDWNTHSNSHNDQYYASIAVPMFAPCGDINAWNIYQFMKNAGAFKYPDGIPSSLSKSGQQWDFPSAWAPHNHMIIEALRNSGNETLSLEAFRLAQNYIRGNYQAFRSSKGKPKCPNGCMFEKLDCERAVPPAHTGEYPTQIGFGWTNGAVLDLLHTYGDRIKCTGDSDVNYAYHEALRRQYSTALWLVLVLLLLTVGISYVVVKRWRKAAGAAPAYDQYHLVGDQDL